MTTYAALLRGINVGGRNRVPMAELRRIVGEAGGDRVRTLLQSGNVVFASTSAPSVIRAALEKSLAADLQVRVPVMVRTAAALRAVVIADPLADVATDPKKYLVAFCSEPPTEESVARLKEAVASRQGKGGRDSGDQLVIAGQEAYLWCPSSVRESLFATVDWDKQLSVTVTMRNWDTVRKLAELAEA